jgi:hypothetical protein
LKRWILPVEVRATVRQLPHNVPQAEFSDINAINPLFLLYFSRNLASTDRVAKPFSLYKTFSMYRIKLRH